MNCSFVFSFPHAAAGVGIESFPGEPEAPLRPRAAGVAFKGDSGGDGQFDLSGRADAAAELQSGTDVFGAFAHAGESPVSFKTGIEDLRVHTTAIIANQYMERSV